MDHDILMVKELGMAILSDASERQKKLGQFYTAPHVASLMAGMFAVKNDHYRVLDAGAGKGILTLAFIKEVCSREKKPQRISVTLYELDTNVLPQLQATVFECRDLCSFHGIEFEAKIINSDFISSVIPLLRGGLYDRELETLYNIAIVNPPYKKIHSSSAERLLLRSIGIETSNLYAAFISLIIRLLEKNGELVAITPRSFANGPYFESFRKDLLSKVSFRHLHLFESRRAVFREQSVLQENVIFHGTKGGKQLKYVSMSWGDGTLNGKCKARKIQYDQVVQPEDAQKFIHFDIKEEHENAEHAMKRLPYRLSDLGLSVSTGRVVEFRAKPYLETSVQSTPLIYAHHFNGGFIEWPKSKANKPNGIRLCPETLDLLIPADNYVLVKRFSSKEERRRLVACVYDPQKIKARVVGFENHINYFHINGKGLPREIAIGLAAYLNSSLVDVYFRRFSGHTQVNATDLRKLTYPSREQLELIGKKIGNPRLPQAELDEIINQELWEN